MFIFLVMRQANNVNTMTAPRTDTTIISTVSVEISIGELGASVVSGTTKCGFITLKCRNKIDCNLLLLYFGEY